MRRQSRYALLAAVALTIPWIAVWVATTLLPWLTTTLVEVSYSPPVPLVNLSTGGTVLVSGLAILGGSFLLAWGAETAEKDVPRAFAIAVLAILAVAPEYAVDALYAWNAGVYAGTARGVEAGNLAVANMTGANRILIGVGWAGIALFTLYRHKSSSDTAVERRPGILTDAVTLDRDIDLEIVFLLLATLWAFLVPFNGGIDLLDMIFLVGLYVAYILIILRGDIDTEEEHVGVPADLQMLPRGQRLTAVIGLFLYAGFLIFTAVEPFAHGLEHLGTDIGIPSFFMIQWIAPLASESPELIVVAVLVNKARSTAGFNALISSKLNQWTLLIGTLVVVHSVALGQYGVLAFDQKQAAEIWLTAAQSFFALGILINFEISAREALGLLVLFTTQVIVEFLMLQGLLVLPLSSYQLLLGFSAVYIVLGVLLFVTRRAAFVRILQTTKRTIADAYRTTNRQEQVADD